MTATRRTRSALALLQLTDVELARWALGAMAADLALQARRLGNATRARGPCPEEARALAALSSRIGLLSIREIAS